MGHELIILEGAISVLSAVYSEYAEVVKIILREEHAGATRGPAHKILRAARTKNIEIAYGFAGCANIGRTHGGVIALARKRRFSEPADLLAKAQAVAVIEGVEDPYNLGYAVRALYTQGADGLILPERDFGLSESVIEKASTGTFYKMPAATFKSGAKPELVRLLKTAGFRVYCVNHKAPAGSRAELSDIFDVKFAEKSAFIIGGEKRGISRDFLLNADEIIRLPYANAFAHSLAAQTAATIVAYELHRQRRARASQRVPPVRR